MTFPPNYFEKCECGDTDAKHRHGLELGLAHEATGEMTEPLGECQHLPQFRRPIPGSRSNDPNEWECVLCGTWQAKGPPERTEGTRLILATENLLDVWGTRTIEGYRIIADWGEQCPEGWYEPTFTVDNEDRAALLDAAEALDRLTDAASVEEEDWSPQTHDELVAALNEAGAVLRRLRSAPPSKKVGAP